MLKKLLYLALSLKTKLKKISDVDILVEIDDAASLIDFVKLKQDLEEKLKKKVELVEYTS